MNSITYILGFLSALSLASILIKRPWTIIIAHRSTPPEVWTTSLFLETNMIITGAWTILLALAAVLSFTMPFWVNLVLCAVYFLLGRLSSPFGSWYSSKRLKSLQKELP
jgi:hypothetical protein